ncbi:MAG: hypothetical protein FWG36_09125 [Oscillospiraceae bacterium]|nr:hypothetical protein [Oscillospiraceae bacterium]
MNNLSNNKNTFLRKFHKLSAIPIALCISFSLLYNVNNRDTGLRVLGLGLILVLFISPVYLTVLSCYGVLKKSIPLNNCITTCLLMNAATNSVLIIVLGVLTGFSGAMILWMLPFFAVSMAIMAILSGCLFIVKKIKQRHDSNNLPNR